MGVIESNTTLFSFLYFIKNNSWSWRKDFHDNYNLIEKDKL